MQATRSSSSNDIGAGVHFCETFRVADFQNNKAQSQQLQHAERSVVTRDEEAIMGNAALLRISSAPEVHIAEVRNVRDYYPSIIVTDHSNRMLNQEGDFSED